MALRKVQKFTKEDARYTYYFGKNDKNFDAVIKEITDSEAYKDPNTRIIIDKKNRQIHFGCSLLEIEASFPKTARTIVDKRLTEDNIMRYVMSTEFKIHRPIHIQKETLQAEASTYFKHFEKRKNKNIPNDLPQQPNAAFKTLLSNNPGLIVGESHDQYSSKKILIENMKEMKAQGVKAIFFEHLLDDTQRELLAHYLKPETKHMPPMLKNYLTHLDRGNNILGENDTFTPYSFLGVVMQAKKYGIDIIPFDTTASYTTKPTIDNDKPSDQEGRCLMMNYLAAKKIETFEKNHPNDKYIVFCGSKHINSYTSGVPGFAEITGLTTLQVKDIGSNVKDVKPDINITMNTYLENEGRDLLNSAIKKGFFSRVFSMLKRSSKSSNNDTNAGTVEIYKENNNNNNNNILRTSSEENIRRDSTSLLVTQLNIKNSNDLAQNWVDNFKKDPGFNTSIPVEKVFEMMKAQAPGTYIVVPSEYENALSIMITTPNEVLAFLCSADLYNRYGECTDVKELYTLAAQRNNYPLVELQVYREKNSPGVKPSMEEKWLQSLRADPGFTNDMQRAETEAVLKEQMLGTYVLRNSSSQNGIVLSFVKDNATVEHFIVKPEDFSRYGHCTDAKALYAEIVKNNQNKYNPLELQEYKQTTKLSHSH